MCRSHRRQQLLLLLHSQQCQFHSLHVLLHRLLFLLLLWLWLVLKTSSGPGHISSVATASCAAPCAVGLISLAALSLLCCLQKLLHNSSTALHSLGHTNIRSHIAAWWWCE